MAPLPLRCSANTWPSQRGGIRQQAGGCCTLPLAEGFDSKSGIEGQCLKCWEIDQREMCGTEAADSPIGSSDKSERMYGSGRCREASLEETVVDIDAKDCGSKRKSAGPACQTRDRPSSNLAPNGEIV